MTQTKAESVNQVSSAVAFEIAAGIAELLLQGELLASESIATVAKKLNHFRQKVESARGVRYNMRLPVAASWRSGYAADCKSVHTGSIPVLASKSLGIPLAPQFFLLGSSTYNLAAILVERQIPAHLASTME